MLDKGESVKNTAQLWKILIFEESSNTEINGFIQMRNPEGGTARSICLNKVPSSLLFFFLLRKTSKRRGYVALNLTIYRMWLRSNRQQPSTPPKKARLFGLLNILCLPGQH